jgi:hypothetical protein
MKRALIALLGLASGAALSADAPFVATKAPIETIDLGKPGALDALQAVDPERHGKLTAILRAAEHPPCESKEMRLLKASNELRELRCGFLLMTSLPPKRHLSFVLDDVHYQATVTMRLDPSRVMKAVETR